MGGGVSSVGAFLGSYPLMAWNFIMEGRPLLVTSRWASGLLSLFIFFIRRSLLTRMGCRQRELCYFAKKKKWIASMASKAVLEEAGVS